VHVVLIRDTPTIASGLYDCLEGGEGAACAEPISTALPGHPDLDVAKQFAGRVQILDLTSAICDAAACPMLKGNLIVYQDRHHLTATFARTLAPQFQELLSAHDQNEMHDQRPDSR